MKNKYMKIVIVLISIAIVFLITGIVIAINKNSKDETKTLSHKCIGISRTVDNLSTRERYTFDINKNEMIITNKLELVFKEKTEYDNYKNQNFNEENIKNVVFDEENLMITINLVTEKTTDDIDIIMNNYFNILKINGFICD